MAEDSGRLLRQGGGPGRIRVAVDVDSVLADVMPALGEALKRYNTEHGTRKVLDYRHAGDGESRLTMEEFLVLYSYAWNNLRGMIRPIADPKLLARLAETYDVTIVSSRGGDTLGAMKAWLDDNGMGGMKTYTAPSLDKSTLDFDFYIDDDPDLPGRIASMPRKFLFLVDMFNNRDVKESPNVMRVRSANEAMTRLVDAEKGVRERTRQRLY